MNLKEIGFQMNIITFFHRKKTVHICVGLPSSNIHEQPQISFFTSKQNVVSLPSPSLLIIIL